MRVDDLSWDLPSGAIRFSASACGTFRFDGVVRRAEIAGRVTDMQTNRTTDVRLRRGGDERQPLDRAAWLAETERILKRRKPRC